MPRKKAGPKGKRTGLAKEKASLPIKENNEKKLQIPNFKKGERQRRPKKNEVAAKKKTMASSQKKN